MIARSDGSVLYNFAVAVDDAEMEITDVVRGDDHLSNTPRQLVVLRALGVEPPRYAHLPLLHGPDGKKLSKRHGAASVEALRADGYLPGAVRNYLALLGWGTEDDTTLMGTEELIERFSIERVGRSSAIFDEQKLRWINGRFMREMPLDEYERRVTEHLAVTDPEALSAFDSATPERRRAACAIVQEKAQTLDEVWPLVRFLFAGPADDPDAWGRVMTCGYRSAAGCCPRGAAGRRRGRVRANRDRGGAARGRTAPRCEAEADLPADSGGDHRHDRLAGDLRVTRGARQGGVRGEDRAGAGAAVGARRLKPAPHSCRQLGGQV